MTISLFKKALSLIQNKIHKKKSERKPDAFALANMGFNDDLSPHL